MAKRSMFVGMDVHKESIDISLAEEGWDGEARHYGKIAGGDRLGDVQAILHIFQRAIVWQTVEHGQNSFFRRHGFTRYEYTRDLRSRPSICNVLGT